MRRKAGDPQQTAAGQPIFVIRHDIDVTRMVDLKLGEINDSPMRKAVHRSRSIYFPAGDTTESVIF
jgi:hypothetical protein